MSFQDPQWLFLLVLALPWWFGLRRMQRLRPSLPVADGALVASLPESPRVCAYRWLTLLRLLALALAIVALARPQVVERETTVRNVGVDLVVALDLSTSMLAEDRPPGRTSSRVPGKNRLAMAKDVLGEFLDQRPGDRIGLVVFGARPYPAAPLTLDHTWLKAAVSEFQAGAVEDGTAVGDAILASLNRLRARPGGEREESTNSSGQRSQAIILVTDGRNNAGATTPQLAASAAKALGVRIHAIGIGSHGRAVLPVANPFGGTLYRQVEADLDEATLSEIATTSGGSYQRADDRDMLAGVFREIDRLEKRPAEQRVYFSRREVFPPLLLFALLLAASELALRATWLRRVP
jgi:Ca-activated chloride channel family protein